MNRKMFSRLSSGVISAVFVVVLTLITFSSVEAHQRRGGVVVRHGVYRPAVHYRYRPVTVVRYVPSYHLGCTVRSGYYYSPSFGHHHHRYHPGGIHFGIHLGF